MEYVTDHTPSWSRVLVDLASDPIVEELVDGPVHPLQLEPVLQILLEREITPPSGHTRGADSL